MRALSTSIGRLTASVGFLEWRATSERNEVHDGADSYVFNEDGRIRAQTIHYSLTPVE